MNMIGFLFRKPVGVLVASVDVEDWITFLQTLAKGDDHDLLLLRAYLLCGCGSLTEVRNGEKQSSPIAPSFTLTHLRRREIADDN